MSTTPILDLEARLSRAVAPHLSELERRATVYAVRDALGLRLVRWSHAAPLWLTRFSMYLSGFGRVVLSRRVCPVGGVCSPTEALITLTHELVHAARARSRGAAWWRVLYFLSPSFRRAEELEADAHSIAMRAGLSRANLYSPLVQAAIYDNAEQWSGWRAPYFCGGSFERATADLERRVRSLLKEDKTA